MLSRIIAQPAEQGLVRREAHARRPPRCDREATAAGRRLRERVQRERARTLATQLEAARSAG